MFCFAFIKLYLYYYILVVQSNDQVCKQIDNDLCGNSELMLNLRFYCLKLLRLQSNTNEIAVKYIKNEKFRWCTKFKEEIEEQNYREI